MDLIDLYAGWWFGTWLDCDFPHIGNVIIVIIPTDELTHSIIFQRGRSTTNQVVDGQQQIHGTHGSHIHIVIIVERPQKAHAL